MSQLELSAWRFLAQRRTGSLAVAHIEFIDGEEFAPEFSKTIVTPASEPGFYESVAAATFGEAAIALALQLGMPCIDYGAGLTDFGPDSSSAAIADNGESESSSPRTRLELADSTTDATGAGRNTGIERARARQNEES